MSRGPRAARLYELYATCAASRCCASCLKRWGADKHADGVCPSTGLPRGDGINLDDYVVSEVQLLRAAPGTGPQGWHRDSFQRKHFAVLHYLTGDHPGTEIVRFCHDASSHTQQMYNAAAALVDQQESGQALSGAQERELKDLQQALNAGWSGEAQIHMQIGRHMLCIFWGDRIHRGPHNNSGTMRKLLFSLLHPRDELADTDQQMYEYNSIALTHGLLSRRVQRRRLQSGRQRAVAALPSTAVHARGCSAHPCCWRWRDCCSGKASIMRRSSSFGRQSSRRCALSKRMRCRARRSPLPRATRTIEMTMTPRASPPDGSLLVEARRQCRQ